MMKNALFTLLPFLFFACTLEDRPLPDNPNKEVFLEEGNTGSGGSGGGSSPGSISIKINNTTFNTLKKSIPNTVMNKQSNSSYFFELQLRDPNNSSDQYILAMELQLPSVASSPATNYSFNNITQGYVGYELDNLGTGALTYEVWNPNTTITLTTLSKSRIKGSAIVSGEHNGMIERHEIAFDLAPINGEDLIDF